MKRGGTKRAAKNGPVKLSLEENTFFPFEPSNILKTQSRWISKPKEKREKRMRK
jgi:hypothetical protein